MPNPIDGERRQQSLRGQNFLESLKADRFDEVFVEAGRPRPLSILLLAPSGDSDEAEGVVSLSRTQSTGGLAPIHTGHPEIHQHMCRRPFVKGSYGLGSIMRDPDCEWYRFNCPLCTVGDNANKARIYKLVEMDADHVAAWSKGGASSAKNFQMFSVTRSIPLANRHGFIEPVREVVSNVLVDAFRCCDVWPQPELPIVRHENDRSR